MNDSTHIMELAAEEQKSGKSCILVTVLDTGGDSPAKPGFKLLITGSGELHGTVGGGAVEHTAVEHAKSLMISGRSEAVDYDLASLGMKCGGRVTLVYEYLHGGRLIVLFGGGHVAAALAPLLETAGFTVVIFDPRQEVAARHIEHGRTVIRDDYQDIGGTLDYLDSGFCFIATHGHEHDTGVLKQVLLARKTMTYVGVIGSKRKIRAAYSALKEENILIPDFVYAPVGLNIGGDTAGEIAVSIAAEVLSVINGKHAPHMRDTVKHTD